ncbi:hypothetical protein LEP1GSC163_1709 [Leptospira santarosai str. CBC379]|uniref:Uncharacterized protein n=1 Tax=Leptospira santarosai str. MOR084 TaxID=1049984 RepID=A0A0E2BF63_9LEPT|nr:hypothetical protein LEP1GSC179_2118 [Leptospira santarosai str. MOR084]EKR90553.1 hypothetical protein LEP1GSC163_1709 [Leptospira santarosai str. CBC379]EMP82110.1 hypothetical protein LEP1GSC162_1686 [Leptospira santarosai str. CBC1531]
MLVGLYFKIVSILFSGDLYKIVFSFGDRSKTTISCRNLILRLLYLDFIKFSSEYSRD